MTLLRTAACGLFAGAVGTLAMDLVWYRRYKQGDGDASFPTWEFGSAPDTWDKASAPANVGKLLYETATHTELETSAIGLTTNVMHWVYGVQWGVILALAVGSGKRVRLVQAALLGPLVWLASYVSLPIAGFYKPLWSYDLKTLWSDLSAHLVYGVGAVGAFWIACRF